MICANYAQWESASQNGLFQRIDPRVKVLFLIFFVVIVSLKRAILQEVAIGTFVFLLALASRLNLFRFYKKVFFLGFFFGFLIGLPSALNLVARGELLIPLLTLPGPYDVWIYHIPARIGITGEGAHGLAMLTLRVMNSVSIVFLVLHTTTFSDIMKALKIFRIPDGLLMTAILSYKYFFIFARTVQDMHLAKKSKQVKELTRGEARRWVAGRIALIFTRTQKRSEDIFKAMLSRGFSNTIKISGSRKLQALDGCVGLMLLLVGAFLLWRG